ncbi:Kinase [Spironucleus salmonicida]|uniref:Kinase n=1 Tax=Spironucleus salmonicida TaxID=348837 RepID=V6LL20_9EUKA|nr:Kinase [Spironucleus salmonicida]|eukprot:EST45063.1 DTW domain-containing protein [Spironucleus salmonicida]
MGKILFKSHSLVWIDEEGLFVKETNYYEAYFYQNLPTGFEKITIPCKQVILSLDRGYKQNSHIIKLDWLDIITFLDLKLGFLSVTPRNKLKIQSHINKCRSSTSQTLGFRLQQGFDGYRNITSKYGYQLSELDLQDILVNFVNQNKDEFIRTISSMIQVIQYHQTELFGTGLLIYYDSVNNLSIKLIDFANSSTNLLYKDNMVQILKNIVRLFTQ